MNTSLRLRLTLLLVFLPLLPAYPLWGAVIYVDASATGANDGSSWTDAFNYLQNAIGWAGSGSEIWVAQGTYRPDEYTAYPDGTNERFETFYLQNKVALYGGFPSGGGLWESRDPNTYKAILSGDIGFPDDNSDNSYHVVTGSNNNLTAILDGFTITAGNADGDTPYNLGSGMYNNDHSYPNIINCTFTGNSALHGGGMGNYYYSHPNIVNCTFTGNSAGMFGGGMYNEGSYPTLTNCTFTGNSAAEGGGMFNESSEPTLTNCTFSENQDSGMFNKSSDPTLTNCTFTDNLSDFGSGIYNFYSGSTVINCLFSGNSASNLGGGICNDHSNPTLTNSTFSGNSANIAGGGMYSYDSSSPKVINCTFTGNSADQYGGGMYTSSSSSTVTNCTFTGNLAASNGGGMYTSSSSSTVTNCTFTGNSADQYGGGMYTSSSSSTLTNCILWGNTAPNGAQIYNTATVTFSDIQGGWSGTGNINADPLFVDANDNLRLSPGSPCTDKGNNAGVPPDIADLDGDSDTTEPTPLDLDLRPRFIDGDCNDTVIVDMGAFEFSFAYFGDFDNQCDVDFRDFAVLALAWLTEQGQTDYNPICDISAPADYKIDMFDLEVFCENWLQGIGW